MLRKLLGALATSAVVTQVFGLAVVASVALLAGAGQASAVTCSGNFNSANGTTSLPGTNIGTVASGCEIGPFNAVHGSNGNAASVSTSANPSIYQFTWTGGILSIQEEIGNNGIGHNINVELGLSSVTLNSNGSLSSNLASIVFLDDVAAGGPTSAPQFLIQNVNLAAGTYVLDTYLGLCAVGASSNCSGGTSDDPQYQVLFTLGNDNQNSSPSGPPAFCFGIGWSRVSRLAQEKESSGTRCLIKAPDRILERPPRGGLSFCAHEFPNVRS